MSLTNIGGKSKKLCKSKMTKKSRKTRGGDALQRGKDLLQSGMDLFERGKEKLVTTMDRGLDKFNLHRPQLDQVVNLINHAKEFGEVKSLILPDLPKNLRDLIKKADKDNILSYNLNSSVENENNENTLKRVIKTTIDSFPENPWNSGKKKLLKSLIIIRVIKKSTPIFLDAKNQDITSDMYLEIIKKIEDNNIDVFQHNDPIKDKDLKLKKHLKEILKGKIKYEDKIETELDKPLIIENVKVVIKNFNDGGKTKRRKSKKNRSKKRTK